MFDILDAPVIGPLIESATGGLGDIIGGTGVDPDALVTLLQAYLVNTIVLPPIFNFIILVVATVIGGFIGRLLIPVRN